MAVIMQPDLMKRASVNKVTNDVKLLTFKLTSYVPSAYINHI